MEAKPRTRLDHSAMLMEWKVVKRNVGPFRFEIMWKSNGKLRDLLDGWWKTLTNSPLVSKFNFKIGFIREKVKKWNKVYLGNIFEKKKDL